MDVSEEVTFFNFQCNELKKKLIYTINKVNKYIINGFDFG